MIDDAVCQARLVVEDQRNAVLPGNILCRSNDVLAPINRGAKGNPLDFAARDFAANSGAVQHAGQSNVVDIPSRPGNFVTAFLAKDRSADYLMFRPGQIPLLRIAYRRTRLPMTTSFWEPIGPPYCDRNKKCFECLIVMRRKCSASVFAPTEFAGEGTLFVYTLPTEKRHQDFPS